jgi:hypothetical protein
MLLREGERHCLHHKLSMYAPWNVYNVDETGLFYQMALNHSLKFAPAVGVRTHVKVIGCTGEVIIDSWGAKCKKAASHRRRIPQSRGGLA